MSPSWIASVVLVTLMATRIEAGQHYWWMNNPSIFSSGGSNSNHGGSGSSSQQQSYQTQNVVSEQDDSSSFVETECPVGTKCVEDHFCNEQAVMVNFRVDLTPAQKRNRGKLIPCVNSANGGINVCCSTASQQSFSSSDDTVDNSDTFVDNNNNNNQGFSQQLQQQQSSVISIPSGQCPNIGNLPPVESCSGKTSNCWSVGQADVDCPNNALCCFDGCVNACYFGGSPGRSTSFSSSSLSAPAPAPAPTTSFHPSQPSFQASSSTNFDEAESSNTFTVQEDPNPSFEDNNPPAFNTPAPVHTSFSGSQQSFTPPRSKPSYGGGSSSFSQETSSFVAPAPQPNFVPATPVKQPQPFVPARQQNTFQPSSVTKFESAETKPFVTCPSAMKCVPRVNCDFNGVMTDATLNLTPDLEMLRVPLIPCVNPMTTNIDVCCRDPNYTDPWPDMNGNGNNFKQNNNGNGGNFNKPNNNHLQQPQVNNNNNNVGGGGILPRVSNEPVRKTSGYGK